MSRGKVSTTSNLQEKVPITYIETLKAERDVLDREINRKAMLLGDLDTIIQEVEESARQEDKRKKRAEEILKAVRNSRDSAT